MSGAKVVIISHSTNLCGDMGCTSDVLHIVYRGSDTLMLLTDRGL